ncbi:MAG: 2,3,4,5-tetrahydropyridine-2,6-carboxylate N-succinyltransferase [Clostridia bacterium]|nr:2,3,4,5-tetrahydropyridine-2,6-carboxylate N-succinyltransferase [Clostridia bacterium]
MDGVILMNFENVIRTKRDLNDMLKGDKNSCFGKDKVTIEDHLRKPFKSVLYRFFRYFRIMDFYIYRRDNCKNIFISKLYSLLIKYCDIRKNHYGLKIGVEMLSGNIADNIRICHPNVILNGNIGAGCVFHGNNVIGNKRSGAKDDIPVLGKNVDVGIGAMVIGNVRIADDCIIGAGAVVTKSFDVPGSVIAGVPARIINKEGQL